MIIFQKHSAPCFELSALGTNISVPRDKKTYTKHNHPVITLITVQLQAFRRLKSAATRLFVQQRVYADKTENTKLSIMA